MANTWATGNGERSVGREVVSHMRIRRRSEASVSEPSADAECACGGGVGFAPALGILPL